jgi:LacI family transcriptional regulator
VYGKYNTEPYDKLKMDLMYINNMTMWEDLHLMFATVKILFMPESTEGIADGQVTATYFEEETSDDESEKEKQSVQTLIGSRVAGMLVGVSKETTRLHHLQDIIDNGIPLVLYDRPCPSLKCDQVVSDDYTGAFNAVEYLIQTGRKRIMYLSSSIQLEVSRRRYQGWRDALLRYHMPILDSMMVECDTRAKAIVALPNIMQGDNRPDAIFCVNDDCAAGVLHVAKIMGIKVPEELSICGFSDAPVCHATSPMLTTVQQHGAEIGKRAMARLLKRLDGDERIQQTEMVPTDLIVRETTM